LARIAGVNIPTNKRVLIGLQYIHGIGQFKSKQICQKVSIPDDRRVNQLTEDEGIRADTTYEGVARIKPAIPGGVIAAGNASQFSDGASACVVMDAKLAEKRNLKPLGIFRGFAVAGCEPDEMGIGPVFAVPKLLKRFGLTVGDIDLFELNEAFASVVLRYMQAFDIPHDKINVAGGAIAMGHPLGATGAMILGTVLDELERRNLSTALVTLCVAAGMGAATIIERV